jgi:uncharacterized LabA/DUF88 family protein
VLAPIGNILIDYFLYIMMDKAAVFIDNGYFKRVLKALSAQGLDYNKFSRWICSKINAELYRTYFYDCMPYQSNPATDEERERFSKMEKYVYSLRKQPRCEVRLGRLIRYPDGKFKQKGVDILLTIDLTKLSFRGDIQKAVLVACDSDFVPAVKESRGEGIIVISCYSEAPGCGIHDELHTSCDDRIEITQKIIKEINSFP